MINRSVLDWPTGVTVFKPEKCYNGYTVVTPYRSNLIFLIDMIDRRFGHLSDISLRL